ncbi:carbohydrate-binding domain-containing protein [Azospirillum thermophilum]|uniref:Secreted sugar hydrolase-like protein (Modular protein) n=1 Tax=Azospirillum thermophilum TaxID=2202148 RepID=A0A2S2D0E1_9PROT|nr:carbohydrate-binding domain-containing protein [Azospirillum thermophilum]AWK90226.1 secreted sugar hydrolase-like protein (modular protein) [Azospirillum thermophilum]
MTTTADRRSIDLPIIVNAWGVAAGGRAPHFKLLVDGVVIGDANVWATSSAAYGFRTQLDPDVGHRITIWYDNDGVAGGVDRNLFVGSIVVGGQEIPATDLSATYDKGVVDGKDVVRGQSGLYWGGALSFGLGEEMFDGPVVRPPPRAEEVITRPVPITVTAAGGAADGVAPRFTVLLDGRPVGEAVADGAGAKSYGFTALVDPSQAHRVQIRQEGGTGGLQVGAVTVNGRTVFAAAGGPPLQAGGLDLTVAAPLFQGTASAAAVPAGAAFYVAANGKDSWSGRLAAPNADGTDGPFASLERAQAAMRGSAVKTTYVREGTYSLTRTLELTGLDSGVRILGYPGEQAVISGGQQVTGFSADGQGRYSAPLAAAPGLDVTVGGVRYSLASKAARDPADPRTGWYVADAAAGGASKTALRYREGDVAAADLVPGSRLQVFDTERLQDGIVEVASIDTATRTITFKSAAPTTLRDGSTFRLLGNPAHVDQPGEFAYSAADRRLVIQAGDGFDGRGVEVARLGTLVRLAGATGVTVEGLTFANALTDGAALELVGADGNGIAGNSFLNVGTAIRLRQGADGNLLSGNYLDHLGINGILLESRSNANRVIGNRIQHVGEVRKGGAGIMGYGVNDSEIAYNDIDHAARYGISLKNWDASTVNLNTRILYNRVRHTGEETADSGAIELLGRSGIATNTLIQGNWVEHAGGLATDSAGRWLVGQKGFGVYLDDMASGVTVRDNFFRDTAWASVMIHGGHDNLVTNNLGILASNDEDFLRIEWVPIAGAAGTPYNNTVTGNLISGTSPLGSYLTLLSAGSGTVVDGNLLDQIAGYGPGDRTVDPAFADAYNRDYRLLPGSTVLAFGFRDLDWASMGVPRSPLPLPGGNSGNGGGGIQTPTPSLPPPVPSGPSGGDAPPPAPALPVDRDMWFERIVDGVLGKAAVQAYRGPVSYLDWAYLGDERGEVVGGSSGNDFLNLLGGNDAAAGGPGDDVLDGGSGSNWLIGGVGKDTFFVDGRNPQVTWSTLADYERGEWATLWGFRQGVSRMSWVEMGGADGFKGATVHCDIDGNGSVDASITFSGMARSALTTTFSTGGDSPYVAFIAL